MIHIRRLEAGDAEALWQLRLIALESEPQAFRETAEQHRRRTIKSYADRLRNGTQDNFVYGAFDGESLVGMVGFYRNEVETAWIWGMFVLRERRGAGVGRALMEEIVRAAKVVPQLRYICLEVAPTQEAARRLYQSCGFRPYSADDEHERLLYPIT